MSTFLLGVIILLISPPSGLYSTVTAAQRASLKIGWIGTITTAGKLDIRGQSLAAAKLAAEHVNQTPDLLPDFELELVPFDDSRSVAKSASAALNFALNTSNPESCKSLRSGERVGPSPLNRTGAPFAVVGPVLTDLCISSGRILGTFGVPQIAPSCLDTIFRDKKQFPTFGRLLTTVEQEARRLLEVVRVMKWTRIAVFVNDNTFGKSGAREIQKYATLMGVSVVYWSTIGGALDNTALLLQAKRLDARVILTYGTELTSIARLLVAADKLGMMGHPYVWLHGMGIATGLFIDNGQINNIISNLTFTGHLAVVNYLYDSPRARYFRSEWDRIRRENNTQKWPGTQFSGFHLSTVASYDAVWVLANIAKKALSLNYLWDGFRFVNTLGNFTYLGVQGPIVFDKTLSIEANNQAVGYITVNGTIAIWAEIINETVRVTSRPIWSNGQQGPVADGPPQTISRVSLDAYIAVSIVTGVVIVITLSIIIFVLLNWEMLKPHSPNFLLWILVSNSVLLATNFVLGLDGGILDESDAHLDAVCNARVWIFGIPFTMAISSLLAKNIRIWLIFLGASRLETPKINSLRMVSLTLFPVAVEIIILILWRTISPLEMRQEQTSEFYSTEFCTSTTPLFVCLFFAWKTAFLVTGVVIAYYTRKISSKYNEAKIIGYCTYSCFVVLAIIVPIVISQRNSPNFAFILSAIGVILLSFGNTLIIFVPKVVYIVGMKRRTDLSASNVGGVAET